MRRILIICLTLTFLLTSCGTLEVTLVRGGEPTSTPASDVSASGSAPLSMDSTSAEIRQLLLDSPMKWQTIFMDAQVSLRGELPQRVQVWVDQPDLSVRSLVNRTLCLSWETLSAYPTHPNH